MKISGRPTLLIKMLLKKSGGTQKEVFPLNVERCSYFYSARYALAAGIQTLGLDSSHTILMPSYNCWVEIDPVRQAGLGVRFYDVTKDFKIDISSAERLIDRSVKAFFVTHYFGFPQDMKSIVEFCRTYDLFLIEDCAHAFLSNYDNKPLGSFGDISIFSLRKSLPIPNGAVLVFNNSKLNCNGVNKNPNIFSTLYYITEYLMLGTRSDAILMKFLFFMANVAHLGLFSIRLIMRLFHKLSGDKGLYLAYPNGNHFQKDIVMWGMSPVSKRIISHADFAYIRRKRRENFAFLLNSFYDDAKISVPLREIPEGVCPLLFPILTQNRDEIYRALKAKGFAGFDWWGDFHPDVPWEEFPTVRYLKKHVFGFPIHQDLDANLLDMMVAAFREYQRTM